ncbi:MAG: hypothetical protein ACYCZ6_01635 [Polaromonas sp.]
MAKLRIRFKLNPGREGVPLGKLSKQSENIEKFLRSIAADLNADDSKNGWVADHFKTGSLEETISLMSDVPDETLDQFDEAMNYLLKFGIGNKPIPSFLGVGTIECYSVMRQNLDPDERLGIGLFHPKTGKAKPFTLVDRFQLEAVGKSIETEVRYIGAVMGSTHEWNKGAEKPFIVIRELNSQELIRCNYSDGDYAKVAKLFGNKTAIVIIEGSISQNLITSKTEVLLATGFEFAPDFSGKDFDKFFGAIPGLTGDLTSEEFVAKGRNEQ